MKRLLLTITAVTVMAGPLAVTATDAAAQDRGRWDRRESHGDHRRDHWDSRSRWDGGRHNGFDYDNHFHYGAPPSRYYGRPGYRPGYETWRRGSYLPSYYRGGAYVVHDYDRHRLRPPPRGYYWYRTGNDYVLAAIATGLIFDVIINAY